MVYGTLRSAFILVLYVMLRGAVLSLAGAFSPRLFPLPEDSEGGKGGTCPLLQKPPRLLKAPKMKVF